jgi:protein transport protein SEC24
MYRKHCAPAVQPGQVRFSSPILRGYWLISQLILPEGFKLLPLYTLCMLKSKALKGESK